MRSSLSYAPVIATIAVFAALGGTAMGGTRPAPDLKVSAVSGPAGAVVVGSPLDVRLTTKNAGSRRAKGSTTGIYLSRDAKKSRDDRRIASIRIKALKPRKSSRTRKKLVLPAGVAPASGYRLLACVDDARKLREKSERNNCRVAKGTLTVADSEPAAEPIVGPAQVGGPIADATPAAGPGDDGDADRDGSPDSADCSPNDPAIHPGADDKPDVPALRDANCDGIDGDASRAVFVSPDGDDANPGTADLPKRTVNAAILAAASSGSVKDVYLAGGDYGETVALVGGVGLYGGYSAGDWSRSLTTETKLAGSGTGAVASEDAGVVLQHLGLTGRSLHGKSTNGLMAVNSSVTLERVTLRAEPGAAGAPGSSLSAPATAGSDGDDGSPGDEAGFSYPCDVNHGATQGGRGGASSIGRPGGKGGNGDDGSDDGEPGEPGSGGAIGGPGTPDGRGNWNTPSLYWGENGARGNDGFNGGAGAGSYAATGYTPGVGGTGGAGTHGHGGGGGGGGGGGTDGCNSWGGGGGGGGAGGRGGVGGGGGGSGGGSFGIFAWSSTVSVVDSTVQAGDGGNGGAGGAGQQGGAGGVGGHCVADGPLTGKGNCYGGGSSQDDGSNGGRGGFGGAGGNGGNGGGGAGGPSVAVVTGSGATVDLVGSTLSHGAGGAGGLGGGGNTSNAGPGGIAQPTLSVP